MADMVNQTLTHLLAPASQRGASKAGRPQDGGSAAREPFANSLDRSMARPERAANAPDSARNSAESPAPAPAAPAKTKTPEKSGDTAPASGQEPATHNPGDASAADGTTENGTAVAADANIQNSEAGVASGTIQATDMAASLAATPAALAVASASPATADALTDMGLSSTVRNKAVLDSAVTDGADRRNLADAGEAAIDLDAVKDSAKGKVQLNAIDSAPNKLRATPFHAQLEARLEVTVGGGRPVESIMPLGGTGNANALVPTGIQVPTADRPLTPQAALPIHVNTAANQAGWADAVGNRVLWLVGRDESRAELILTPPSLGKLEISLTVSGDSTTAHFVAATPAAREALEHAMPRLREMFEQAGVTLAESNVNTAPHDQSGGQEPGHGQRNGRGAANDSTAELIRPNGGPWLQRGEGMIDIFA